MVILDVYWIVIKDVKTLGASLYVGRDIKKVKNSL